jgi:hypothetical protein
MLEYSQSSCSDFRLAPGPGHGHLLHTVPESPRGARPAKRDILSSLSSRNAFMWLTDMPDVPNVHIRQTRLPRCKYEQPQ